MEILIADDDTLSLHLMRRTLEQSGYTVIGVQNGRRAVEELSRANGPRLALIDWMMPEMDGPVVCRTIRSRENELYKYILLLTAKESSADIVTGLEAGADDYLTKPCHPSELLARLHTGRRILSLEDSLVEARDEMRYRATHDALTALWNRGGILSIVQQELERVSATNDPVSLLLCDIDHFKQVNDRYGHLTGDDVLRKVAERLGEAVRIGDSVGRYGGEEFLIALHGCGHESVQERAEQVRSAIEDISIMTDRGPLPVSISVGAITIENWNVEHSIEQALSQADTALYRAKAAGRNRVMYAHLAIAV